jgi:hypothetical protein
MLIFPSGKPTGAELILEIVSLLVFTFVFFALYLTHRAESAGLSLAGLILWLPAFGVNLAAIFNFGNTFLSNLGTLFISLPFLIFGFLAYRSTRIPRGLAVVTLLTGVFYLITGAAELIGIVVLAEYGGLVSAVFMLAWAVWLCIVFTSKKFAALSTVPVAA